jgi:amino acid transporter
MKSDEILGIGEVKTSPPTYDNDKEATHTTSSDEEYGHGDVETHGTTKRGLKARHAQMIALGGTIGLSLHVQDGKHSNNM